MAFRGSKVAAVLVGVFLALSSAAAQGIVPSQVTNASDGDGFSMALDGAGRAHFTHLSRLNGELRFTPSLSDGSFGPTQVVATGVARYSDEPTETALVISGGTFHIFFSSETYDPTTGITVSLKHATRVGTAGPWTITTVDGVAGARTGLTPDAVACGDRLCACYYDEDQANLKLVTGLGTSEQPWVVETLDVAGDVGRDCDMVKVLHGPLYIAYTDADHKQVKLATKQVGELGASVELMFPDQVSVFGRTPSIALRPDGKLMIASSYYDLYPYDVGYYVVMYDPATGERSIVDRSYFYTGGYTGGYPALGYDISGREHLFVRRLMMSALFGRATSQHFFTGDQDNQNSSSPFNRYDGCLPNFRGSAMEVRSTVNGAEVYLAWQAVGSATCMGVNTWGLQFVKLLLPYRDGFTPPSAPAPTPTPSVSPTPAPSAAPTPPPSAAPTPTPSQAPVARSITVESADDLGAGVKGISCAVTEKGQQRVIARIKTGADGVGKVVLNKKYGDKTVEVACVAPKYHTLADATFEVTLTQDHTLTLTTTIERFTVSGAILIGDYQQVGRARRIVWSEAEKGTRISAVASTGETFEGEVDTGGAYTIGSIPAGTTLNSFRITLTTGGKREVLKKITMKGGKLLSLKLLLNSFIAS